MHHFHKQPCLEGINKKYSLPQLTSCSAQTTNYFSNVAAKDEQTLMGKVCNE
jgi:hypothetical protein